MKKLLLLSLAGITALAGYSQKPENWDGVDVLLNCYGHKITYDGTKIAGETEAGGTFYYDRVNEVAYFYAEGDFGRGYVISDEGTVVGCQLLDVEDMTNIAVLMKGGHMTTPEVFKKYMSSNIHSITPDGTRICGVVSTGNGPSNEPFYCDIDANGNFSELKFLPVPEKDFFGNVPQYTTANWMSKDGKTILGQVMDFHGSFTYPVVYQENEQGVWSISYPSKSLFNPQGLPIPEQPKSFEETYPGVPETPELEDYMTQEQLAKWEAALKQWEANGYGEEDSPYNNLTDYMSEQQIQDYNEAVVLSDYYKEEYNEKVMDYQDAILAIADSSVLFIRNGMAMSGDGQWIAATAEIPGEDDPTNYEEPVYYYIPYLFNVETGESWKVGQDGMDMISNQVFPDGNVICATPANAVLPPRSFLYLKSENKLESIYDYVNGVDPQYGKWMEEYLTGNVQVDENDYQNSMITGNVVASEDFTVISGGVLASALGYDDMEITYIMSGLVAGVEELVSDPAFNGVYTVYNLQGLKVLETKDASQLYQLPKGVYIVNGKKYVL